MRIDLNADLGESFGVWRLGDDEQMLSYVTSANVACGFHAGDPYRLRETCRRAVERGVVIGAQVGYRDLEGFGRRFMDIDPTVLLAELQYQLGALDGLARIAGERVCFVKAHGALYEATQTHAGQAEALVRAVLEFDSALTVLTHPGSALARTAERLGLTCVPEVILDRAYDADGTLVPRRDPRAAVLDPIEVAERAVRLAFKHELTAVDGTLVACDVRSLSVSSENPGAVLLAQTVRQELKKAGVEVRAFADA